MLRSTEVEQSIETCETRHADHFYSVKGPFIWLGGVCVSIYICCDVVCLRLAHECNFLLFYCVMYTRLHGNGNK